MGEIREDRRDNMAVVIHCTHMFFEKGDSHKTKSTLVETYSKQGYKQTSEVKDGNGKVVSLTFTGQPQIYESIPVEKKANVLEFDPTGGDK